MPTDSKNELELLSIYTAQELSYAQSRPDLLQTLTEWFAAKGAIKKCATCELAFIDIEILPDQVGKPNM